MDNLRTAGVWAPAIELGGALTFHLLLHTQAS